MDMVERVARVLYQRFHMEGFDPHNEGEDARWADFEDDSRAIMQAMREPSEDMIAAGIQQAEDCSDNWTAAASCAPEHIWRKMIDTALAEPETT